MGNYFKYEKNKRIKPTKAIKAPTRINSVELLKKAKKQITAPNSIASAYIDCLRVFLSIILKYFNW